MAKKQLRTATVYYDYDNREHYSPEEAIAANVKFRQNSIESAIEDQVADILKKVPVLEHGNNWDSRFSRREIARYLITTDLVKANRKIKQLIKKATEDFDNYYTDIVLK